MIEINLLEEKKSTALSLKDNKYVKEINFKFLIVAFIFLKLQGWVLQGYLEERMVNINQERETLSKELQVLNKKIRKNKKTIDQITSVEKNIQMILSTQQKIKSLFTNKKNLFPPLKRVAEVIPQNVWLTELSMNKSDELFIKGLAENHDSISNFTSKLNSDVFFENSFTINEVKTIEKKEHNNTIRNEFFTLKGKITSNVQ